VERGLSVLIAAPLDVVRELGAALGDGVKVVGATTFDDALACLKDKPNVIVVCYVFDELRPYRLIQHVRSELEDVAIPIVLVRALPVRFGSEESAVKDSYLAMGVNQFLNVWTETQRHGRPAALQQFSNCVFSFLPPGRLAEAVVDH
jgi:PleD family two-component response regulator